MTPDASQSEVVVRVKFVTRRQLKQAWVRDLSRNTLFVRTDLPLAVGTRVALSLELPDEQIIEVPGEVSSIVPLASATPVSPAGMAVQMRNFDGGKRSRIEEFLRRSHSLPPGDETQRLRTVADARPQPAMENLVRALRRLVWLCGDPARLADVDHYQLLGVSQAAHADEIREACTVLRVLLDPASPPDGLADKLTPDQHARLAALHAHIAEAERTLTNPESRSRYDDSLSR